MGLFPSFAEPGGVQLSGRLAWEGISNPSVIGLQNGAAACWNPCLFSYGSVEAEMGLARMESMDNGRMIFARSKAGALVSALRTRWPVKIILVWHLALLKLLPFFRGSGPKIALFLHGIEAWKRHDWLTRKLLRRVDLFLTNS